MSITNNLTDNTRVQVRTALPMNGAGPEVINKINEMLTELRLERTPGGSTAAAGSTTSDAGVLPAGTSRFYPTTAANGTRGVRINAADQVTGRRIYIGNGVSNQILLVYPPTGGTINGAAANAAFSSASGKGVIVYCLDGTANTWLAW